MRAITGSTRTIWIMAGVAVLSLVAGLLLSRFIVSPDEAASNAAPPEAGPITVPVEQRALANDVVMRGDGSYEDSVDVKIETGGIEGPAVVTGQVPEVGATLDAGAIVLEVTGRPVILLPGELPVYRTLRAGVSGPDVVQLKAALRAIGIDPGNDSNAYDAATATAIRALYARVGYPAPSAGEDADATLQGAREAVRSAEEAVATAKQALATGGQSLASGRVAAQAKVDSAQARLNDAKATYDACVANPTPEGPCGTADVATAQGDLATAIAERDEANRPVDTADLRAAVTNAQQALKDAQTAYAKAQQDTITPLPASEVLYLAALPRRVDAVTVERGSMIAGAAVMSVSGATLTIAGTIAASDADLVAEGAAVTITLPDGTEVPGTIQSVGAVDPAADAGTEGKPEGGGQAAPDPTRKRVVVVPNELTDDQRMQVQGANVKVKIPVSSTEGEVLAVPIAALTAGPGGESRVEVLDDGAKQPRLVTVKTGLAAGGFVEVTATDGSTLAKGDQVVVGVEPTREDAKPTADPTTEAKG